MKQLIFISTFFVFLSCTKGGGNVYLKGRVYNPVTNEGVSNVTIELVKDKPLSGDPVNGGSSKVVKSVTSDANGNIELSHTTNLTHNYFYRYSMNGQLLKEMGWDSGVPTNGKEVKKGSNDYDNLKVVGYGSTKQTIENVNCVDENDSMRFSRFLNLNGEDSGWSSYRLGCYYYQGNFFNLPEGDYRYDWYVIRNGVRTDSSRVFQVRAGQENLIELLY